MNNDASCNRDIETIDRGVNSSTWWNEDSLRNTGQEVRRNTSTFTTQN